MFKDSNVLFQLKVQRTLNWVLSQDSADSSSGSGSGNSGHSTPEPGHRMNLRMISIHLLTVLAKSITY